MASNSLHLTTMCLKYRPTVVAAFCIYIACKWSRWEVGSVIFESLTKVPYTFHSADSKLERGKSLVQLRRRQCDAGHPQAAHRGVSADPRPQSVKVQEQDEVNGVERAGGRCKYLVKSFPECLLNLLISSGHTGSSCKFARRPTGFASQDTARQATPSPSPPQSVRLDWRLW